MHMMEQTPEAEAGSHRASGHRIENATLREYQMSPFAAAWRYTLARRTLIASNGPIKPSNLQAFSLAAMISQVR
jgi:hypothetical protein